MKTLVHLKSILIMLCAFLISCEDHSAHHTQHVKTDTLTGMEAMSGMNHSQVDHSEMLLLSAREQWLAGIQIDTLQRKDFQSGLTLLGEVAVDESTVSVISSKVKGRIEKLYLRNPGDKIHKGEVLYDIYSETLYAEQLDLLQLHHNAQAIKLIDAARTKLLLHGLTPKQISTIEKQKIADPAISIYSNVDGFLTSLPVREGQYVETGDVVFEVASLDIVRINVQVYPDEISSFNKAVKYEVQTGAEYGKTYTAIRVFENPSLESNTKIHFGRLRVTNTEHVLRPGMRTSIKAITGSEKLLLVPKTALIVEREMSFVWVMEKDGMFSRRMVKTGPENEFEIEILSGLEEGEHFVSSGSYLLNSEYILKKGTNTMGGMKM